MADYINREELIKDLKKFAPEHYSALVNTLIEKQPAVDVVSIGVLEQVRWERDVAIEQLAEYGVCFGEKKKDLVEVIRCKDCKHYIARYCTRDINGRTNMFLMNENDFCSYGERKAE